MAYASSIVAASADPAGIRVLDDHAGRERELRGEQPRGGEVVEVVVRELLPVQLLDAREQVHARACLRVERAALVRVLAVREVEHLREGRDDLLGERLDVREPARDRRLVGRRRRERDGREACGASRARARRRRAARRARRRTAPAARRARRGRSSWRRRAASKARRRRSSRRRPPRARRGARRPARTDRGSRRRGRTAGSRAPRASRRRPRGRGGRGSPRGSAGCSVFTRPSSISGASVTSSTLLDRRGRAPR